MVQDVSYHEEDVKDPVCGRPVFRRQPCRLQNPDEDLGSAQHEAGHDQEEAQHPVLGPLSSAQAKDIRQKEARGEPHQQAECR